MTASRRPPRSAPPAGARPAGEPLPPAGTASFDHPDQLRRALTGVRALLIDLDGVILSKGAPLPGVVDALRSLRRRKMPFLVATNASLLGRRALSERLHALGLEVEPERIVSALSASAAYTASHFPGQPIYVLASRAAPEEFAGQLVLSPDEASAPGAMAAAVVVGDASSDFTFASLNAAFRLLRGGARFVAMHRNPWWLTADGHTLDAGAFVRALEFATRRHATLVGKPNPAFFTGAVASLGDGRLRREEVAMVGDDVWTDVVGAQRAGLRGILVLTGRHGLEEAAEASNHPRGGRPDAVTASLSSLVVALD